MDKRRKFMGVASDERGATAIEYGLIVSLIVIAMLVAMRSVAQANTKMWNDVAEEVGGKAPEED